MDAQMSADLATHHIEGFAREDPTRTPFSIPLISPVTDTLWQGGCREGVNLRGYFQHIVSLYPHERYYPGDPRLQSFVEVNLLDGPVVPDERQLYTLAYWINACQRNGRVLVHCQAGLNRSGLVAGLSLIVGGMAPAAAIALLRAKRCDQVLCNVKFSTWLLQQSPNGFSSLSLSPIAV